MKSKNRRDGSTSYLKTHNKAVRLYRRSSIFLLFSGILNIFAIVLGILQVEAFRINENTIVANLNYYWPISGYSLSYSIQQLINNALLRANHGIMVNFLIILIALLISGLFGVMSFFASKGNKWTLFLASGLYALDFALMFILYSFDIIPFIWANYVFTLVSHIIVMIACIIAIIEYYNVIHLEYKYNGQKLLKLNEEIKSEVIAYGEAND